MSEKDWYERKLIMSTIQWLNDLNSNSLKNMKLKIDKN